MLSIKNDWLRAFLVYFAILAVVSLISYFFFSHFKLAFLALIPYIWNILDLMKPSTVIDKLTNRITKENILKPLADKGEITEKYDPIQQL